MENIPTNSQSSVPLSKTLLNVGGGTKDIPILNIYKNFKHELLDANPTGECEYPITIEEMDTYPFPHEFDGVYSCHTLEHLYLFQVLDALKSFYKVTASGGFIDIIVPHFPAAIKHYVESGYRLWEHLYKTETGLPIVLQDVIYGHQGTLRSKNVHMLHKCCFDVETLAYLLGQAGYVELADYSQPDLFNLRIVGWKDHQGFEVSSDGEITLVA